MEFFTLNNGIEIPAIGLGTNTIGKRNQDYWGDLIGDYRPIATAVELGYRMFDSARGYRNEGGIGSTLLESGVPREELFYITKLPGRPECVGGELKVRASFEETLKRLHVDYVDLYMIHHPWGDVDEMVSTYKVMEKMYEEGLCRSIGVSNFSVELMELFAAKCDVAPAVNEYQINPFDWQDDITEYCNSHDIVPIAWGPLLGIQNFASGRSWTFTPDQLKLLVQKCQGKSAQVELNRLSGYREALEIVGERHGKTWSQIQLRFYFQAGIVSIPKSFNSEHQKANLDIFDFELSEDEFGFLHDVGRGISRDDAPAGALHKVTHKDLNVNKDG